MIRLSLVRMAAWVLTATCVWLAPKFATAAPPRAAAVGALPVNPQASPAARSLLRYLYAISGRQILSGQHNYTMNRSGYSDRAAQIAGKYPTVWGSDFGHGPESLAKRQEMVDEAKRQHAQGSIITLMWHAVRPIDEETAGWQDSVQSDLTPAQWRELVTPGTPLHKRWLAQVDTIAAFLKQLRDANVPVLWRPYHEMNGDWFWWGQQKGDAGYKKLWRLMYDRLANYHKLNNVLWVWNAGAPDPKWAHPYADYYPGARYADVLAADIYGGNYKQSHHDDLLRLAKGKPIALGEVGELPTPADLNGQPRWTWFMIWPSHLDEKHNKPGTVRTLYNDARVLTRDEVRIPAPPPPRAQNTRPFRAGRRTYHLGNSLTDTLNDWLAPVARSAGYEHDYLRSTIPGAPTDWNWEHPGRANGEPDYRVAFRDKAPLDHLFTQPFAGHDRSVENEAEYSGRFYRLAREKSPNVQHWLYAQWPDKKFDDNWAKGKGSASGLGLPVAATWEQAARNHSAYVEAVRRRMDEANGGKPVCIVPGGLALARLKQEIEARRVPGAKDFFAEHFSDDLHLSAKGAYLIALVHYACIYQRDPAGVTFANTGLTPEQAAIYQRIAWETARNYWWSGVVPRSNR